MGISTEAAELALSETGNVGVEVCLISQGATYQLDEPSPASSLYLYLCISMNSVHIGVITHGGGHGGQVRSVHKLLFSRHIEAGLLFFCLAVPCAKHVGSKVEAFLRILVLFPPEA